MLIRKALLAAAGVCLMSGCATVVDGTSQQIQVDSSPQGATIFVGVRSEKTGNQMIKRQEVGVTPATVTVHRKDGVIVLEKAGFQPAEVPMGRSMNNWIWGDILLTSPLSTSIDTSTGASNEFDPGEYLVEMKPAQ